VTTAAATVQGFTQVFSVRFQHAYYNADGERCRDFKVAPSSDCARLMASLGMIFRDTGAGFAVFIDSRRIEALVSYVRDASAAASGGGPIWPRLTFLLNLANPLFIGVTDLPITTSPLQQNLFASNLTSTTSGGQIRLGAQATLGAEALVGITGPSLSVAVPAGAVATLTDLAGRTVGAPSPTGPTTASFGLAGQPCDLYTVAFTGGSPPPPAQYCLYLPARPISMGLLDLLLTPPAGSTANTAAFPLPTPTPGTPTAPGVLKPVDLVLAFAARDTVWQYYVVSQDPRGRLTSDLGITGVDTPATAKLPVKASQVTFTRTSQTLPNGDQARTFTASDALPLFQRSPYVFRLSGHRQGPNGGRDQISVPRLPVAPVTTVWPGAPPDEMTGRSEMFVYV
jgi:hypothetical protein